MKNKTDYNMEYDTYGEVINGEGTYSEIALKLKLDLPVLIGWTDDDGTHFDILFVKDAEVYGTIQGGVKGTDLFVSVMRRGAFGFEIDKTDTHSGYYSEKLGGDMGSTSEKLAELINGVKKYL